MALVAAAFALAEGAPLVAGGVVHNGKELGRLIGLHSLPGLAVGLLATALAAAVRPWLLRTSRSAVAPRLRWISALPTLATTYVLTGTLVNVALLPAFWSLPSLAGNLGLAGAFGTSSWLWSKRPWGHHADRLLLAGFTVGLLLWAGVLEARLAGDGGNRVARGRATTGAPHILLVLIDTLRPDYLGCYGDPRGASPELDRLAAEGVVFDNAFSASNWTRPTIASLFSSTMPTRHQVTTPKRAVSRELPLLAETLVAAGYETAFFTTGTNVEPADGYGRGVDQFYFQRGRRPVVLTLIGRNLLKPVLPSAARRLAGNADPLARSEPGDLTDRALEWVAGRTSDRPSFIYLHYAGPHDPYSPPAEFDSFGEGPRTPRSMNPPAQRLWGSPQPPELRRRMIELYLGEILWHDQEFGRLLEGLEELGHLRNAALFVTSDHGEAFGEHALWGHGRGMFNEVVRVPLIYRRWPDGPVGRVAAPVSSIDLAPTIAELAGGDLPASFDGAVLAPWWQGNPPADRLVFVDNPETGEYAVQGSDWAYLERWTEDGMLTWLFERSDHGQLLDLAAERPEVVSGLQQLAAERRQLDAARAVASRQIELDAQRIEQLRTLGYLD